MQEITYQSDRAHARIKGLIQRRGLEGLDPNSQEAQFVRSKIELYASMAAEKLPPAQKEKLVQLAVEIDLLRNSVLTSLLSIKVNTAEDRKGEAKRKAFQIATNAYRSYCDLLVRLMKELTCNEGEKKPEAGDFLSRLKKIQKEKEDV